MQAASDLIYALVLAGDIFEVWLQPIWKRPMTEDELLERLRQVPICREFKNSIRQLIASGVKVFYLHGNHDHRIGKRVVHEMLSPQC